MAYLRSIDVKCSECKTARAVVELIDRWNGWSGSRGSYCRRCGQRALKLQQEQEQPTPKEEPTNA